MDRLVLAESVIWKLEVLKMVTLETLLIVLEVLFWKCFFRNAST